VSEQQISIAGQDIAFTASEGTGRTVVFVHRNSSSARVWHPLLAGSFGERFRCLALDLPDHGGSAPAKHPDDYSLPGYAAVLAGFAEKMDAEDAVIVGWSLGGHIALEAAPQLPEAAGFVIFGTPPIGTIAADFGTAFLPHPAVNVGFTAEVDTEARCATPSASSLPDRPCRPTSSSPTFSPPTARPARASWRTWGPASSPMRSKSWHS
jgi:pimeloyl-ACP methyl ester carboxylesterase